MKNYAKNFKPILLIGSIAIVAVFVTKPASSQETSKNDPHKTIVLKVISDDNGKKTIIDTTMEMPDSTMMDSINREIDKVINMHVGGKHSRFKIREMPEGYSYNFELPCPPECPMELEGLEGMELGDMEQGSEMEEFMHERMSPRIERRIMKSGGHGQSLNDMLGDIPMDRVVSYSIKDRKGGKRIVIDLNDAPMFENQEKVIVIREPGRSQHNRNQGDRQVKVIVNTDGDAKTEQTPPPPTPPPAKTK